MTSAGIVFLVFGLAVIAWLSARARASLMEKQAGRRKVHSRPHQYAAYTAIWTLLPPIAFLAVWANISPALVTDSVLATPQAAQLPTEPFARASILGEARSVASGDQAAAFNASAIPLIEPYRRATSHYALIGGVLAAILAFAGGAYAFTRIRPDFRARNVVERLVLSALLIASLIAIVTTVGIVLSLLFESARFFSMINPLDFLFGLKWSPQSAAQGYGSENAFGAIPLFWGTIFIGVIIAMIVAIPLGLLSAIYLTQYAAPTVRAWMKPTLEMLAGVPTVVYGYFAALTVAPALRTFAAGIGIPGASSESALAAGIVMGVMIIPFVSSMADDSIAAVPQSMRDGSLAMGATTSETIRRVLIPAALPGVVGGVLLAVSRAIGETMIVVMAAGLAANLTLNPFASVTTVTTQIVQLLTGDQEFDSPKTLAAFALGLVLFVVTLLLNIVALHVVKKYREAYE